MEALKRILSEEYGIAGAKLEKLVGEVSQNYRIEAAEKRYVLKVCIHDGEAAELAREESELLVSLADALPGRVPRPLKRRQGGFLVEDREAGVFYRLLEYLEGEVLADSPYNRELYLSLGALLGSMDRVLEGRRLPWLMARRYDWDNLHFDLSIGHASLISDPAIRRLVEHFHLLFHEKVLPRLPRLRFSLIHNDANDYNILVRDGQVSGIIDFGDVCHTALVNEVAIALAYAMMNRDDPLECGCALVEGYCGEFRLQEEEVDLLYYLVGTRLSISLLHSARAKREQSANAYLGISERPAMALLQKWVAIGPQKVRMEFRRAASLPLPPLPHIPDLVGERWKLISRAYSLSYDDPISMEASAFQYMYDDRGNAFLDLRNNIPHVGHCHPRVVRAGQEAMARLNTNTRYLYDEIHRFSEKLLACFPADLNRVFYVNSGSAASDLAIRLARTYSQRKGIMVMEHGYHGNTETGIEISHYKFSGKAGSGPEPHIFTVPIPHSGLHLGREEKDVLDREQITSFLGQLEGRGEEIAAFITEAIVSAAGQVEIPKAYMQEIYAFVHRQGGLCISDEVQTGFGRLGRWFWGYEQAEVVPDIVVLGKPIGNGHPMAAVVCRGAIADSFHNGMEFFSSFGGNPVSCAIGEAVLDVIREEKLAENAAELGDYLSDGFRNLREAYPCIGEIRGSGLSLGIEIVQADGLSPDTALAGKLVKGLRERNILVGTDGPSDNVFKLKPPLCFNRENADRLFQALREVLS